MNRILVIFAYLITLALPVFADDQARSIEAYQKLKMIYEKKKSIQDLADQRNVAERALIVEFQVNECNRRRMELIQNFQAQSEVLINEIKVLEESLGTPDA